MSHPAHDPTHDPASHPRLRRIFAWSIVVVGVLGFLIFTVVMAIGPHMITHAAIRPHQAQMPPLPAGAVPTHPVEFPAPTTQQAQALKSPVQATPENLARGQVYYQYYCVFCHDTNGSGNAEVGRSYTPAPTDLRSQRLAQISDGEYLRRSLTGQGHSPVLEELIPPDMRWYIVLYARSFAHSTSAQTSAVP